ncbi:MAG: hypothetical protein MZV64_39740 [Ignavibacteriales bacterium]|nr:hypothetical protein [Ignavibacteriales bacterium]
MKSINWKWWLYQPNRPIARDDQDDAVYKTKREKYNAIIEQIEALKKEGRPVLVGTTSVEVSETISRMLKRKGVQHNVLNAKQHQKEAEVVAHAGEIKRRYYRNKYGR